MARYDKYDGVSGGFRAALAADWAAADYGVPFGVGLDSSGRVVKGAGVTGVRGVLVVDGVAEGGVIKTEPKKAGDMIDVMTAGDIVETGIAAGTKRAANVTTGVIGATGTEIGFTVEAGRLVVRCSGTAAV